MYTCTLILRVAFLWDGNYDTLNFMQCDVVTYCIGMAASMSTVLLAAGTPGKRYALPNSRVMIHQPSAGGQTSDISIAAKEILGGEVLLIKFVNSQW